MTEQSLSPPENDDRAAVLARIIRLAIFALIALVGLVFLLLPLLKEESVIFSPLWFYGLILVALSSVGAALDHSGRRIWAIVLVYALIFDVGLAVTSLVGNALKLSTSFMPVDKRSMLTETGFRFHPLLQIMLTPGYSQGGFDHTPQATRAVVEPAGAPDQRMNVALVGGSSTYDIGRKQGETWPDRLQESLPQYRFWNYGVPSYTSIAHIVQTAWYLPELETRCAIYYFGWNDIRNNNLPSLDPAYAEYHLLDLGSYARDLTDNGATATWRLLSLMIWKLRPQPGVPNYYATISPRQGFDPKLEIYYQRNIETLIGINRQRGIRTGFIGQLLNDPLLKEQPPGQRAFGAPGVEDRNIPQTMKHFNTVMAATAARNDIPYLEPEQDWLAAEDYIDFGHFSVSGARKFSDRVSDFIDRTCSGRS